MTRLHEIAQRYRWWLLGIYFFALLMWSLWISARWLIEFDLPSKFVYFVDEELYSDLAINRPPGLPWDDDSYRWILLGYLLTCAISVALFQADLAGHKRLSSKRRSPYLAVGVTAAMAALLTVSLIRLLVELSYEYTDFFYMYVDPFPYAFSDFEPGKGPTLSPWAGPVYWLLIAGSAVITIVLWCVMWLKCYADLNRYVLLHRMAGLLFVMSVPVLLASGYIQWRGMLRNGGIAWSDIAGSNDDFPLSYSAAVIAATVLLWASGCSLLLLFPWRRWLRLTGAGLCPNCSYDLHGTIAAGRSACPECGRAMTADQSR